MHIMSPVAGRIRRNTSSSGILSTKRKSPLKTSRFTRMLVPNPKYAFQSPGVHRAGFFSVVIGSSFALARACPSVHGAENPSRIGFPPENAPLCFDHAQSHLVELVGGRAAASARHEAAVPSIAGFA